MTWPGYYPPTPSRKPCQTWFKRNIKKKKKRKKKKKEEKKASQFGQLTDLPIYLDEY